MAYNVNFVCYIGGRGERWKAVCTPLDLTVFGTSADDVETRMALAVRTYILDAIGEKEPAMRALLVRRSPWFTRLRCFLTMRTFEVPAL